MTSIPASLAEALGGRFAVEREVGRGGMATVLVDDRQSDIWAAELSRLR